MKIIGRSKRNLLLAVTAMLTMTGISTAYLTSYRSKDNELGVGKNPIQITEDFPDPIPTPGPGNSEEYRKVVQISNRLDGPGGFNVDCYVRVLLSYNNSDIGKAVTLIGLDQVNWFYNANDGFYYYRHVLREQESTTPLMTGFRIDRSSIEQSQTDTLRDFEINVYTESVGALPGSDYAGTWERFLGRKL